MRLFLFVSFPFSSSSLSFLRASARSSLRSDLSLFRSATSLALSLALCLMKKFVFFLDRRGFFLDCGDRCGFFLDRRSYSPERALFSIRAICSGVMDVLCLAWTRKYKECKAPLSFHKFHRSFDSFITVLSQFHQCFMAVLSVFYRRFYQCFIKVFHSFGRTLATAAWLIQSGYTPDSRSSAHPPPTQINQSPQAKASSAGIRNTP